MISKARSKTRLPIDDKGKPERCYTHQSESVNMLTRRKVAFITTDKGKQDRSKLQFTTEVFQPAIYSCLQFLYLMFVENHIEEYIRKFPELTTEQDMEGKTIKIVTMLTLLQVTLKVKSL